MFHKYLMNESTFSLNPTVMGTPNIARQQPVFDHVPHVIPRLIGLPSLLSYLLFYPPTTHLSYLEYI